MRTRLLKARYRSRSTGKVGPPTYVAGPDKALALERYFGDLVALGYYELDEVGACRRVLDVTPREVKLRRKAAEAEAAA